MDVNGARFWLLADSQHWHMDSDQPLAYDAGDRCVRLPNERLLPDVAPEDRPALLAAANGLLASVPGAVDRFGTYAVWDAAQAAVMAGGAVPSSVPIYSSPSTPPTDLVMGEDDALYLAIGGAVTLLDRRGRWDAVTVQHDGFTAQRLTARPEGGVWALDAAGKRLARVHGLPLPRRPFNLFTPPAIEACQARSGPRLDMLSSSWPDGERAVALATGPDGRVALLLWRGDDALIRVAEPDGTVGDAVLLSGVLYPYSVSWVDNESVAVLSHPLRDAPVYPLNAGSIAFPRGDIYPLRLDYDGGPFLHAPDLPPQYRAGGSPTPLYALVNGYASQGICTNKQPLDSGSAQTVWHRLFLEAELPPGTGALVELAVSDEPAAPHHSDPSWYGHAFGEVPDLPLGAPTGAWMSYPSEIPFHPGLLPCPRERNRAGLFTVLIQRYSRRVSALRGRYLWIRLTLYARGRTTPSIYALRAYSPRFSYRDNYLPELYHEHLFAPDADTERSDTARQSPADFLERLLSLFEADFTAIEGRIASSYLLTDPRTVPEESLDWLAGWVGLSLDSALPVDRRRDLLVAAPQLGRRHGTLPGLMLALDVATGGKVGDGSIVVVEDFRLRRVVATILGADLGEANDPLLAGASISGNSYVGDTLILGNEHHREFLALFAPTANTAADEAALAAWFDTLAFRVTVLVRQDIDAETVGLVRRIVALETPAHVRWRVAAATYPFLVGIASLVGVDTYLGPSMPQGAVVVGESQVGVQSWLLRPGSLDPRLGGEAEPLESAEPPVARIDTPHVVLAGRPFRLNAAGSQAAPGHRITQYQWTLLS